MTKEERKAYNRLYYKTHKDQAKTYQQTPQHKKYQKEYRESNKDYFKAYRKEWKQNNPDYFVEYYKKSKKLLDN